MHEYTCIFHSRKTWSNSGKAFDPRFHAFVRWRIKDLLAICTSRKVLQKNKPSDKLCLIPGRALSCSKQERKWNLAASSGANVDVTMSQQWIYKWHTDGYNILQYLKTSNNVARLQEQHGKRFSPRPTHDEHRIRSNSGTLTSIIQHHSNYHTWNAGGLCKPNSIATPSTPRPQHLGRVSQEWLELSQLQRQEKVKSCQI